MSIYTINLGQDVYGGSLDVTTGEFTVTWIYLKGGFTQYASGNGYKAYRKDNLLRSKAQSTGGISNMIGEFGSFSSSAMNKNIISLPISTTLYMALDENYNASDVEVAYELATPITVQLTPTQIEQLLGVNNVFADTGNINECIYYSTASGGVTSVEGSYQRADGTGVSTVPYLLYTYTATEDCTMCFCGTIATDTSQSQGFLKMVVNDDVEYRTAGLTQYNETPFSFDNISLQSGDTVKFYGDWEGSHSGCFFHLRLSMVKAV